MKINVKKPNVNKKMFGTKKSTNRLRKFIKTKSPKMVSKRLYGYYFTSYEQLYVFQKIKIGFTIVILKNHCFINGTDLPLYL